MTHGPSWLAHTKGFVKNKALFEERISERSSRLLDHLRREREGKREKEIEIETVRDSVCVREKE